MNILAVYGFALLGGMILNVMPCVLPVLTMKVFHVVEQAKEAPSVNRKHGLAYSGGILTFFLGIAAVVIALKVGGESLLWGQQFQNPMFVGILTVILFAFGLNALGVFEFTVGMSVQGGSGLKGSYVNGLVAAVMATPCSAPGLGLCLPFALSPKTPWPHTLGVFLVIGIGLSLPFLLVSFIPAVAKVLPKPGAWMTTFKSLMGFTLMGATVWMFTSLQSILGPSGAIDFLYFLLVLAIALWALGNFGGPEHSEARQWTVRGLAVAVPALAAFLILDMTPQAKVKPSPVAAVVVKEGEAPKDPPTVVDGHINWVPFSEDTIKANLERGRPVFMDFTADWCANCKTNEKLVIETDSIREMFTKTNILPMKVDFTNEDEEIEKWIEDLGRAGIPIYVILYPDGSKDLLPEVITKDLVTEAMAKASAKHPPDSIKPPELPPAKKADTGPASGVAEADSTET